jgi:phage terminase large subunit-like protein
MYWITEEFYQNNCDNEIPYRKWVEQGFIRVSGKHSIVYSDLSNYIETFVKKINCRVGWIYYDSWSAIYLIEDLNKMGFRDCVPLQQGYKSLSLPMQELGVQFKDGKVNYQNNPVTKWCLSNTEVDVDCNGNIKPKKYQDKRNLKIDGTAVLINSYAGILDHIENIKNY